MIGQQCTRCVCQTHHGWSWFGQMQKDKMLKAAMLMITGEAQVCSIIYEHLLLTNWIIEMNVEHHNWSTGILNIVQLMKGKNTFLHKHQG